MKKKLDWKARHGVNATTPQRPLSPSYQSSFGPVPQMSSYHSSLGNMTPMSPYLPLFGGVTHTPPEPPRALPGITTQRFEPSCPTLGNVPNTPKVIHAPESRRPDHHHQLNTSREVLPEVPMEESPCLDHDHQPNTSPESMPELPLPPEVPVGQYPELNWAQNPLRIQESTPHYGDQPFLEAERGGPDNVTRKRSDEIVDFLKKKSSFQVKM
ncbi:MAG: hypothetical protein M1816_006915 [Peltula sp. TS41687]|nr:MAG: hypothetical protein M1816_006915 [Peltula sp. TS41687]